jgi:hypothetical protein
MPRSFGPPFRFARNGEFVEPDQPDLACPAPFAKNISVFPKCKSGYVICHPDPKEGALRNVINAGRVAVDADGAFDESA